jgi:hypothetical protein
VTSRRRLAISVAAIASVASIALFELGARVLEQHREPPKVRRYVASDPSLPELTTFADLDSTYQRGIYKGVLYETNRLRLRSPDRPLAKPHGVFRVALLGDSYVLGEGVLVEDIYATLLERELASVRPGDYEVINTGMSGLSLEHAVKRYGELGLAYDPDLAIYGFTINDIEGRHYETSVVPGHDPYGVKNSPFALWRAVGPGWVAIREAFWPPRGGYVYELRHNYFENAAAWDDFTGLLDRLVEMNRARGICTVLFLHTHLVTLNFLHPLNGIYAKVAAAAEARGIFPIASLPAHLGRHDKSLWVNPYDSHPNVEGHRILADALLAGLATLPDDCWQSTTASPTVNIHRP